MRIVSVDELNDEMKLTRDLIDPENGRVLLGSGTGGLHRFAERLKSLGFGYVYVEDSITADLKIPAGVSEEMRHSAKQSLDQIYAQCQLDNRPDYLLVRQTVQSLIDEVLANKEILVNIYELRCNGGGFLGHSVNVAFLSLLLGNHLGYDTDKLKKMGMGALLHDIGVAGMPSALLAKRNALSLEEKLLYEQHAVIGYKRVKDSWEISPLSRGVILCHHERSDGSGYPHRLLKGDIHEFSRIVGLADCLEELAGGHPFSLQMNIQEAMELLDVKAETWFDGELVREFISLIPVCQTGATVRLNDGRHGVVVAQNRGFPTRPVIRIFQTASGNRIDPPLEVDLLQNNHLVLQ